MKCVIYVKVNQAGKRNWICRKKCYIIEEMVLHKKDYQYICCPIYILVRKAQNIYNNFVARVQHNLCSFCVKKIAQFFGLC